jgi:hypothetical protein
MAEKYTDPKTGQSYEIFAPGEEVPKPVSVGEDVARSAAVGTIEGLTQGAGMYGDVQQALSEGTESWGDWLRGMVGKPPLTPEQEAQVNETFKPILPTTADIEGAIGFDEDKYQPQTPEGEYARTGMSWLGPGAATGRTVKTVVKGAGTGLTAGLGSEAAGQAAEKYAPELEPYARMAGALVAGGLGGKALASRPARTTTLRGGPHPKSPEYGKIVSDAQALERSAAARGTVISPNSVDTALNDLTGVAVADRAFDRVLTPKAWRVMKLLRQDFGGLGADLSGLRKIRDRIGVIAASADSEERRIGMALKNKWDDYVEGLSVADVPTGLPDPQGAVQDILGARDLWRRMYKYDALNDVIQDGINNATSGRRIDTDRSIRSKLKVFLDNEKEMRRFSQAEQDAMREIANGTGMVNQTLSSWAPAGFMGSLVAPGMGATVGGAAGGKYAALAGALAVPAVGGLARREALNQTLERVRVMNEAILGGRTPNVSKAGSLSTAMSIVNPIKEGQRATQEQAENPPPTTPPVPEEQGPFFDQAGSYKDFNIGAQALARALADRGYQAP